MQDLSYILFMAKKRGTQKGTKYIGTNKYNFGAVLAEARRRKGLTQTELAKRLNTSSRVVSYYEREAKNPSWETITKIADALQIVPNKLVHPADKVPGNGNVDRSLWKRFEEAQKMPTEARNQLKKFIDTLTKANKSR